MQTDRRQYYRFDESLMMSYKIITPLSDQQNNKEQIINQQTKYLLNEFSSMTQQIKISLTRVRNPSPEISNCLKILDSKINLLSQIMLFKDKENTLKQRKVNISAGGIYFVVDEMISVGTLLALELILSPELNILKIKAKVVMCSESEDHIHSYLLSAKFIETSDVTRDIIVRHIMYGQSIQLRAEK